MSRRGRGRDPSPSVVLLVSKVPIGQARTVVIGVADMDLSCAFYEHALGFPLQVRDGQRWAQFSAGGLTIALAGDGEAAPGSVGVSIKVADLQSAIRTVVAHGGQVETDAMDGPHERRATVSDPAGIPLYLYAPLPG